MSHASKIALKMLTRRLESTAESYLGKDQFGFRKGCGMRYATVALHVLYERNPEYNNKGYIDYEKFFDRVDWTKLTTILQNRGIEWR